MGRDEQSHDQLLARLRLEGERDARGRTFFDVQPAATNPVRNAPRVERSYDERRASCICRPFMSLHVAAEGVAYVYGYDSRAGHALGCPFIPRYW